MRLSLTQLSLVMSKDIELTLSILVIVCGITALYLDLKDKQGMAQITEIVGLVFCGIWLLMRTL
jgi:hypothetical protein